MGSCPRAEDEVQRIEMLQQFPALFALLLLLPLRGQGAVSRERDTRTNCQSYSSYSLTPHGDPSDGPLGLPFMRPEQACRTFSSSAVEKVIVDMTTRMTRMKDKDLARLFENTFPNTLDTTIEWYNEDLTFVVIGDIQAEWLRDSSNQFKVYLPLIAKDPALQNLTRGVINLQARYITMFPYCNAFQPPPESGLSPSCCSGGVGASISPPDDMQIVWTCGYELDSLLSFLQLSRLYYEYSGDESIFSFNGRQWFNAVEAIFTVIQEQATPTFDSDGNVVSFYNISGPNQQYMRNRGRGPPKRNTGLVGTTYRPSDDVVIFPYNIPHQAMLVVELRALANLLEKIGTRPDLGSRAFERAQIVEDAIWKYGVVNTADWGKVFAYEIDGYGGVVIQDDANVPSLVSIPYLGFVNNSDEIYQNTRAMLLNPDGNPYYGIGPVIRGVGGQHVDEAHPWPMGLITEVITGSDDNDILTKLEYLKNTTTGLGLIHESVQTHNISDYTRQCAWANSYFAESILYLASTKPHLLFEDGKPYNISVVL
ncbi:Six-hairpin glycosidase-like protein [Phellopilus nigrolimitatus]|nr:Six-hairpin glycosidase-like protein [Phellopilus nigrolimitatus]